MCETVFRNGMPFQKQVINVNVQIPKIKKTEEIETERSPNSRTLDPRFRFTCTK